MVIELKMESPEYGKREAVLSRKGNSQNNEEIEKILTAYESRKGALISILIDIQSKFEYLPKDALSILSKRFDIPLSEIFGIVTYYNDFRLQPPKKHVIKVCQCPTCHLRGAEGVLREIARLLGTGADQEIHNKRYSLETLTWCASPATGPCVIIDDEYHFNMSPVEVRKLLKKKR